MFSRNHIVVATLLAVITGALSLVYARRWRGRSNGDFDLRSSF